MKDIFTNRISSFSFDWVFVEYYWGLYAAVIHDRSGNLVIKQNSYIKCKKKIKKTTKKWIPVVLLKTNDAIKVSSFQERLKAWAYIVVARVSMILGVPIWHIIHEKSLSRENNQWTSRWKNLKSLFLDFYPWPDKTYC